MNILTIREMPEDFMKEVVALAIKLREENDRAREDLKGKVLISLYEKPSTRTRLSFETAIANLGGQSIVMDFKGSQLSRGETMADTARVLSRYGHAISARLFKHTDLEELAKHASVPVINALTDVEHPCQALADMQTIIEHGKEKGKLVFIGDAGNNVAASLMYIAARYGMHVVLCGPKGYLPKGEKIEAAWKSGGKVEITSDPKSAVKDADVIYTDVWVSMGEEKEQAERMEKLAHFQVNDELMKLAKPDCIVMHCLPAHRGQEITDSVLDSAYSAVWDQAENRMWAQEALLLKLLAHGSPAHKAHVKEKPKEEREPRPAREPAKEENTVTSFLGINLGEPEEEEKKEGKGKKEAKKKKKKQEEEKAEEKEEEPQEEPEKETSKEKKGKKPDVVKDLLGF